MHSVTAVSIMGRMIHHVRCTFIPDKDYDARTQYWIVSLELALVYDNRLVIQDSKYFLELQDRDGNWIGVIHTPNGTTVCCSLPVD